MKRDEYEVVVIKGFKNDSIESKLASLSIPTWFDDSPGVGAQILLGTEQTSAPIIVFLDDDDEFAPGKLSAVCREFQESPGAVYYHNSATVIDEFGRLRGLNQRGKPSVVQRQNRETQILSIVDAREVQRYIKDTSAAHFSSCIAVPRSIILQYRYFISRLGTSATDVAFFATALRARGKVILDERPLTRYRVHSSNITRVPNPFSASYRPSELSLVKNELMGWSMIADFLEEGEVPALARPFRLVAEMHRVQLALLMRNQSRRMYLRQAERLRDLMKSLDSRWGIPSLALALTAVVLPSIALAAIRLMDTAYVYWPSSLHE
jgi:glycosyltransferase involved in cell wall biosynthesis